MKKLIPLLMLTTLPALSMAAGENAGHDHGSNALPSGKSGSAVGVPGNAAQVTRTLEVVMDDSMRFAPDRFTVKAGETVRFFIRNAGKVPHEMVIGSMDELKDHAEMMRKMPDMQHAEPNMITLKPGQRGALIWKFDQLGTVDVACLIPGHMEAGMVATVVVEN